MIKSTSWMKATKLGEVQHFVKGWSQDLNSLPHPVNPCIAVLLGTTLWLCPGLDVLPSVALPSVNPSKGFLGLKLLLSPINRQVTEF